MPEQPFSAPPSPTTDPASAERTTEGFFGATVARPVALIVVFATLIVTGVIAYQRIPLKLLPSGFQEPELNIWVPNPDASAQENEEKVTRIIEEELRTLAGIEETWSRSSEGSVYMAVSFNPQIDLDLAKAEVRDRIERARPRLPDSVDRIGMWSEDGDQLPISWFGLTHKGDSDRTDFLIEKYVVPRLEAVQGISKIDIFGLLQDSVRILLDEDRVLAARLDLGDLVARLSADNFAQPLGEIDDGGRRFILRTDMRFRTLEEIGDFPVTDDLRLRDLARIEKVKSVRDRIARINGEYAYYGMASKESTANAVEASKAFREAIEEIENDPVLKGEIKFVPFFVQGDLIENSLSQLKETALWGGALAIIVLFVFLRRVRLTLCVALSIPVSALLAIAWEYFRGQSFNVLTMAGLTLAIGMLVDNAVVVIENISRYRALGLSGREAAKRGTREIALAVTLATMTSVVVFMPLIFMAEDPMVRTIFGGIGLPLCLALIFSLIVALVFLPAAAGRVVGDRHPAVERVAGWLAPVAAVPVRVIARLVGAARAVWHGVLVAMHRVERVALPVLHALRFPLAAGIVALAVYVARQNAAGLEHAAALPPGASVGPGEAVPFIVSTIGIPALIAVLLLLVGVPRWRRRPKLAPTRAASLTPKGNSLIEMVIAANQRLVSWTLEHRFAAFCVSALAFLTIVFPFSMMPKGALTQGEQTDSVRFYVEFGTDYTLSEADREMRPYEAFVLQHQEQLGFANWSSRFDQEDGNISLFYDVPLTRQMVADARDVLRENMPKYPGHTVRFYDGQDAGEGSKSVAVFSLTGPDSTGLESIGEEAVRLLKDVPGLINVSSPLERAPDQLELSINRDLALEMGVPSEVALNTIAWTLRGWSLPRYHEEGREVPLIIEYDDEKIAGIGTLRDLRIWSPENQAQVPLSSFATIGISKGRQTIYRRDNQTTLTIQAEVEDPARYMETNRAAYAALARIELPRGYAVKQDASAANQQAEEMAAINNALLLALVLVFLLMGILFESVLLPFSVLFTVPFAFLGAFWTLFLTGAVMDVMGWIGLIILAGVVVNNGIVLIDRIHNLVGEGLSRAEAVKTGCAQRVRPILMTAMTTVFGLIPMAISTPATDSVSYRVLAIIVAGGLVSSTFFTLWVVPLAYTVLDDLTRVFPRSLAWWARFGQQRSGGASAPAPVFQARRSDL